MFFILVQLPRFGLRLQEIKTSERPYGSIGMALKKPEGNVSGPGAI